MITRKRITQTTKDSFRQMLGNLIKERRNELKLSQNDLAKMIESDQPRIAEIENGKTKNIDFYITCATLLKGRLCIDFKN